MSLRLVWLLAVGLFAALLVTPPAHAQLTGVKTAEFAIGGLDADSKQCGLEEAALLNAMKLPIRAYTKIREPAKPGLGYPLINLHIVTLITSGRSCVHAVRMEVAEWTLVQLGAEKQPGPRSVQMWSRLLALTGPQNGSANQVLTAVEDLARQFATAWQNDNP